MYKLKRRWTTRDGNLVPNGQEYSITTDILREYGNQLPPDKGCATCILVRLEGGPATEVFFETTGGHHETHSIDSLGWAHTTMYNPGSGYNPNVPPGTKGPWSVQASGAPSEIVDDIGLPFGWHVSHWVVLKWVEDGTGGGPDPIEPPDSGGEETMPLVQVFVQGKHVQLVVDGVVKYVE